MLKLIIKLVEILQDGKITNEEFKELLEVIFPSKN
jgi:hypothetical protein